MNGLGRRRERGQGLVEFSVLVPLFVLILMSMLEFGFVFDHTLTAQYASREGARVGAALANGGGPLGCDASKKQSPNWATVDQLVIAAVNRVLKSPGSRVDITQVPSITIYKADASGADTGIRNIWTRTKSPKPVVDGTTLDYGEESVMWKACDRNNGSSPDSIGVRLTYTYKFITPIGSVLRFFGGNGWSSLTISDQTVMALNPTGT